MGCFFDIMPGKRRKRVAGWSKTRAMEHREASRIRRERETHEEASQRLADDRERRRRRKDQEAQPKKSEHFEDQHERTQSTRDEEMPRSGSERLKDRQKRMQRSDEEMQPKRTECINDRQQKPQGSRDEDALQRLNCQPTSDDMPGRRRKRCGTWSSSDIKRRRETSRIRKEQETEQEKIERIKDQRERAQNTRNKTLLEREKHRITPRRGIKRNAGLSRKDAMTHQVSEKTRREQERQQIRAERLRVQRERMKNISNEERPILSHVCEKLWNIPHLTLKPLQENSKGNNSGTVTTCKLNRCRNSTTIEGVSKHPETCNCTPDLSKATKTEGPQFLLIPLQSTTTARPAPNLQRPGAKLFQYPNGQIVELVPLPNPGPVTQPDLHQKVTPAVRNPGSLSGNRLPTPTKFCSVASSPSNVTPCRKGIIPQRGPHSTPVVKPASIALKQTSTPHPISAGVSEVPVKPTSQPTFVAVNGVGQTINTWHLVPHPPVVLSLLQLPQGQISVTNVIITAGQSLTLVNQSSGIQSFEKAGFEKTANQDNKSENKLIEPGLEKIHVADSQLIETTVTKGVPDEDRVNADLLQEVKQETDAFPSTPSVSEVDDEDHTMDHQNALEHPTPAVVSKFDSTSSEEAVDIETVEEPSEKINFARLIASASRLTTKSNILKCLPNIYSTNPSSVASSEYHEEPFKIIVKEEPPDDYEYNHAANPVILDCDGLKCKEKEFLDSEGWDGGTNCDLESKTMNKSSINEVYATSSAVTKQALISPIGVAKAKILCVESTKVPVVYLERCTFTNDTIKISELPQHLLSSCRRKGGRIPTTLQAPNSAKKSTHSSSSAENSQVKNVDSKSVCSGLKESGSAPEENVNKTSNSTVSNNPTASPGTPPEKSSGESFKFRKMKYTEKALHSGIWRTPQDALQSHLVEHVSEEPSNPIHPTDPQESEEEKIEAKKEETIEQLEEQLLEDVSHVDPRVNMHPLSERAGLKPNSLMSTDNLKSLGVVISPSSASIVRPAQGDILELSPIKQVQEPLEEVPFVSRTGKTNDFTKLKGWKQKLQGLLFPRLKGRKRQHSESSISKQAQTSAKPEYSLNSSDLASDKLDEYLENEEKIAEPSAALCVNKASKLVDQMPPTSSSCVHTLDSVLKSQSPQADCRASRKSNRTSVSPQPISVGSVSKNTKQIEMTLGPVSDSKEQMSANNTKVSSTPAKSAAKTSLQPSFAPTSPPRLSKKQIELMILENDSHWVEKPRTCITEERAETSLVPLLAAQENSKGNNSGTVTACKLNRCKNSTTKEAMESDKLDGFETNSMSQNAAQTSKWKQKEKADSPLHCDSPQEESTSLQSETPQTSVETKNTSKLIEIISDCNWESERSNIFGVLARYTANKRPLEKIRIGNFLIEIVSNCGKGRDPSPGPVLISTFVVKISQSSEKQGNGKHAMSVPTTSESPGIQLTETPPIAPKETLPTPTKCTVQEKEFTGNANGDTKLTLGQVGALHPVNWVTANHKNNIKVVEPFKMSSSSTVASSAAAHLPSKHLTTCSTSSGNDVLRDTNDATPVNQSKGVSKHPETSNSNPPDLSNATKTDRSQQLLIPVQSTTTAQPAQNLQHTSGQKIILQPLRFPDGKLFQHPNGQIIQFLPLPNPGPVSRPNLHQMVTLAEPNPGSGSGNCLPTPIKSCSVASSPSNVNLCPKQIIPKRRKPCSTPIVLPTPIKSCSVASSPSNVTLCPKGKIPQRGRPRSTRVLKPAGVALKQALTPQPISAVASEVPVKTTSQPPFVAANGVGQTLSAWHLVPLQPMGFALLQLPQQVSNAIITTGQSLQLVDQSSGSQSFEKAGSEKTANQNNKSEEKLIEPGLEEIHVADSELIETPVSQGVPDEDHVNADPSPEVKQATDAFPSTPSGSEVDNELEDDSMGHQNALEHHTPAELVDHSYTSAKHIVEEENENSVLDNSTRTGKGTAVAKDSSRSNHEVIDKDMLKNPENEELDFHQRLLRYENFMDSDKDTDSQSDLEDADSQSDAEEIDVERTLDSTSSEEAMDTENVEEISEKNNIARLIAYASRLTSKSKCHFHNPCLTNKSDEVEEGDIKSKPKHIANLSKEAKAQLDALVVCQTTRTVNERRRRSNLRDLFERLKRTLANGGEGKASKYFILKQAFAEIQNLQNYSDCLSAGKSIQTGIRDSLIQKVSLLTGQTVEVILKNLEYNCALDVEKRTSMQEGDDASEQHSVSGNTASISSMHSLQKVAMDFQIQNPPNVTMLCSGQDLMSEASRAKPLILTMKHSSTPQSSTSSIPLTTGSLLMTPQGQVPTLKGPLISGQTPFFTAEGLLSENQSKGDGVTGASIADDEVSSFMMPRIVNVTSLATGESPLLNLEEANDSCALVPQSRDFSMKGRKYTSQEQLSPMTSNKPSLPIIKSNSPSSGQFTAPDESEAMSFLVSSEATDSECAQQHTQQIADSRSMNADKNADLPKELDLSGLPDGTAVSCARHSWNQDLVPGKSTSETEIILGDKLELQVMSDRLQACSKDKAGGQ